MDFNYIDFDRDENISKEEYNFFLDNFGTQNLLSVQETSQMDCWAYAAVAVFLVVLAKMGLGYKNRKNEDDLYERAELIV